VIQKTKVMGAEYHTLKNILKNTVVMGCKNSVTHSRRATINLECANSSFFTSYAWCTLIPWNWNKDWLPSPYFFIEYVTGNNSDKHMCPTSI